MAAKNRPVPPEPEPEPEDTLTDELDAFLAGLVGAKEEAEPTLERIGSLVAAELERRLLDPALAAGLPGTGLLSLAAILARDAERRAAKRAALAEEAPPMWRLIAEAGLPDEEKRKLLGEQLDRALAEKDEILNAIVGLEEEASP